MNRRDFLSFRVTQQGPTLELSCHGLYMRCLDAQSCAAVDAVGGEDWQCLTGEPPAQLLMPSTDELFSALDHELHQVGRLRVMESEWLASTNLGDRVEPLLAAFRARGGRVDFQGA